MERGTGRSQNPMLDQCCPFKPSQSVRTGVGSNTKCVRLAVIAMKPHMPELHVLAMYGASGLAKSAWELGPPQPVLMWMGARTGSEPSGVDWPMQLRW